MSVSWSTGMGLVESMDVFLVPHRSTVAQSLFSYAR